MKIQAYLIKGNRNLEEKEMLDLKTHQLWKIVKRNLVQTMLIWMNKLRNLSRSLEEATTIEITLKEVNLTITRAVSITTLMTKEEDD